MRSLIFLLALGLGVLAFDGRFSPQVHLNYYEDEAEVKIREKRSAVGTPCEAGWTGQFCENPICSSSLASPSPVAASRRQVNIDTIYDTYGCTGKYYVPVDSDVTNLQITINMNSATSYFNLTDSNGNIVAPSGAGYNDGYSIAVYPDAMPRGLYQLTIKSDGGPAFKCTIEITANTGMILYDGFTDSAQSDVRANGESAVSGVPQYFIGHMNNLTNSAQMKTVTFRMDSTMVPAYRSLLTPRYSCGYEFYAGHFSCNLNSRYISHVDGVDSQGFAFRRQKQFTCLSAPTPTPSPTQGPITSCYNNGTPLRLGTPNATCFCPELFTGRQCEQPQCMNGGYLDPTGTSCVCSGSYSGTNCQSVTCTANFGAYLTDNKTLVVVVRNTQSMVQYIPAIATAIDREVADGRVEYYNYVLIQFSNGNPFATNYPASSYLSFSNDLRAINMSTIAGNCTDSTFDAVYLAFDQYVWNKSPIYLFTDALPSDVNSWRSVTESNTRRKLPIYVFLMGQSGCVQDSLSEGYRALQTVTYFSGGLLMTPSTTTITSVTQFTIKATTYKMNMAYTDDRTQCVQTGYQSFFLDSSADTAIIMAVGTGLQLTVLDPEGGTNTMMALFADTNASPSIYFWEATSAIIGEWLFNINALNSQSPCSIRIMTRSDYDLFLAMSSDLTTDAIDSEPVVGQAMHVVAQLNGLVNATADPFRLFSEITITTNQNNAGVYRKPMYYSNGMYRDGCGYHLYFGVENFCEFQDQMFYATVFADDNNGYTIMRTTVGYCSLTYTTTAPPGTCQNGGVSNPDVSNATCMCPPGYNGTYCQTVVCQNGGTPAGSFCVCPTGLGGTFCELYTCTSTNSKTIPSSEGKSMAFVVAAHASMQPYLTQLANGIDDFVRDVQSSSQTWIKNWILIVINNQNATVVVESNASPDFAAGIRDVANNLTKYSAPDNGNCSVQLTQGLLYAAYKSEPRSSIYTFTDADGPADSSFFTLFDLVYQFQLSINLVAAGGKVCNTDPTNGDGDFPSHISDLAWNSQGFEYFVASVSPMLPFIVTSYKSSVTGVPSAPNCSQGVSYYFAIDGWTQSFTIVTTGNNITQVEVTLPDGTRASDGLYEIIIDNTDPYTNIRQYMPACEFQWQYHKQYCINLQPQKTTFANAALFCYSKSAYMVNVFTQEKDDYLTYQTQGASNWIGLVQHSDGYWYWDVPDGSDPQRLGSYTNWADGVNTTDPNLACVSMSSTGKWIPTDCTTQHYIVCQKHRYGMGIYPGESTNNVIPGGMWKISMTAGSGGCYSSIRSQSEIQVYYGFTGDPHSDFPDMYANSQSQQNYLVTNVAGLSPFNPDTNPSLEGRMNYAIVGTNLTNFYPLTMNDRWFCSYTQVSAVPFSCPQSGAETNMFVKFSGIDQYGFGFERYSDALCKKKVSSCMNGGFINSQTGLCVCSAGYSGSRCQDVVCQNGGTPNSGATCDCLSMFSGTFCQLPKCVPPRQPSLSQTGRTLAIVLETSYNMGASIFQMKRNLKAALDKITSDPTTNGWFSNFILYPFDSAWNQVSWYAPTISTNSDDIVNAVKQIPTQTCPGNGTCSSSCPRPIMGVLKTLLSMKEFATPNSVVLVVTRSSAEDYEISGSMQNLLIDTKAQINFVYPAIGSPCGQPWNQPSTVALNTVIQYSDGNIVLMTAADFSLNFLPKYVPSLYQSGALETAGDFSCNELEMIFQVEHNMYEFTLDFTHISPTAQLMVSNPLGDIVILPPSVVTSDTNYLGVLMVNDSSTLIAGSYRIRMTGGGGQYCSINVRGRSPLVVTPGYVLSNSDAYNGATNDAAYFYPSWSDNNTLVVHVDNINGGQLLYAQIATSYGLQNTFYLQPRDAACGYEWYATTNFVCYFQNFVVIVYGRDAMGGNFRRQFITSCVNTRPAPLPPAAQCDLSTVVQDTVFIIDSSYNPTPTQFSMLTHFISLAMGPFNISPNGTQVGAILVAQTAQTGFTFMQANSPAALNNLLTGLPYLNTTGQDTDSAFQIAINSFEGTNSGYRLNATSHQIIYITGTNPTVPDPVQIANAIKRSGTFGIAVLTIGMGVTNAPASTGLQEMASSACSYYAADHDDLFTNGYNFVQSLSCYNNSICGF